MQRSLAKNTPYMLVAAFLFICSSFASAMTFEEYIGIRNSESVDGYLTGYASAIYENIYFFGGCSRQINYRPFGEFRTALDLYISDALHANKTNLDNFYASPIEPIFTGIVMSYLDCDIPRSLKAEGVKDVKTIRMVRSIAKFNLERTSDVMSPDEITDKRKLAQCTRGLASEKKQIDSVTQASRMKQRIAKHDKPKDVTTTPVFNSQPNDVSQPQAKSIDNMPKLADKPADAKTVINLVTHINNDIKIPDKDKPVDIAPVKQPEPPRKKREIKSLSLTSLDSTKK